VSGLDDLIEVTPEEARAERGVDLRLGHNVVAVDPDARTVTVEHDGRQSVEPYDRLLIATGARAQTLGADLTTAPNVFAMNDLSDAERIRRFVETRKPRSVAVIGGGYMGWRRARPSAASAWRRPWSTAAKTFTAPLRKRSRTSSRTSSPGTGWP
jgi:NADPH-dependent 2,4-dienoyl-CoA reductase/sulfur reductase-like enzyme